MDCTCKQDGVIDNVNNPEYQEKAYELHGELVNHPVQDLKALEAHVEGFGFPMYDTHSLTLTLEAKRGEAELFNFYSLSIKANHGLNGLHAATYGFHEVSNSWTKLAFDLNFVGGSEKECCQKAAFAFDKIFKK